MSNRLFFGDNLDILREYVASESIDLIYLDPPFNSNAHYNVLFQSPKEDVETAQAEAFRDSWVWGDEAEWAYKEVMRSGGGTAKFIDALRNALGNSDMMAYLVMMAVRLHDLRDKLKSTGCMYLHCDPTASHYLKIILDGVFGPNNFRNEIIWKRTSSHNSAKRYGPSHDVILFYTKGKSFTWNSQFGPYDQQYVDSFFTHEDEHGERWRRTDLTGPGIRHGDSGKPWRGCNPSEKGRHWATSAYFVEKYFKSTGDDLLQYNMRERLDRLDDLGLIHWPKKDGGIPQGRRYLKDAPGAPLQDVWTDLKPIHNMSAERLGYPTQKPLTLMDRIIRSSSNEGDVVLDPFCGCGTTIQAAESSNRKWIGIDVAIHAIKIIEKRLSRTFGKLNYRTEGIPRDFPSACKLAERDKYQFQWWANYLFNPHAIRDQKKGADRGIDGELFFPNGPNVPWGNLLISVKGGNNVGPAMIREFRGVLERENAEMGLFVCLRSPTKAMSVEAASAGTALTVHEGLPRLQIVAIEDWFQGKLPKLPPLEQLPSSAFSSAKRRRSAKPNRPDPKQRELLLPIPSDKSGAIVHFNPEMVTGDLAAEAS